MQIDLEAVKYLIGWTHVDEEALPALRPVLKTYVPRILEEFGAYLQGAPADFTPWFRLGRENQERIMAFLTEWLTTRLTLPPDEALVEWFRLRGRDPAEMGIAPVYVVSALEWFRRRLFELIRVGLGPEGAAAARAMGKMMDLTISLTMDGYMEEKEAMPNDR